MTAKLSISIVIPVYNEEKQIKECLDSIARQTVLPDEVIVVDNNCTDKTVEIARTFPLVRIILEQRQGRGHARTAGFNAVKSDIIGRIDADSRLDSNWVEQVISRFERDPQLAGLTGIGITSFIPGIQSIKTSVFSRSYYWFVHAGFRTITMWGSTMAVRNILWQKVNNSVCNDDELVHEDQDLSLAIAGAGGKIIQDNNLKITTSGQTFRYLPKVLKYHKLYKNTMRINKENGNLNSPLLIKLSFWRTLPGRLWTIFLGVFFFIFIILMFPIDYVIARKLRHREWIK